MSDSSSELMERIIEAKLKRKTRLDLSHLLLERIPPEVFKLKWLERIDLSNNLISEIPKNFSLLNQLKQIDLRNNEIKVVPKFIFQNTNIQSIKFNSENYWLDNTLSLDNNPIESPPIEILNQGIRAVRNYFVEIESAKELLYEAKLLIVGEPGAGKTTLAKKILDEDYILNEEEKSTDGIDVIYYKFRLPKQEQDFRINIWDFGGQEIYHSTHQFFLTKRSFYILLSDTRSENTDFNYWLQVVELLSENSPILIVQNEKQDRSRELNIHGMRGRFEGLIKVMRTNLHSKRGLPRIIEEIHHQITKLPHVGNELPKSWVDIRKTLENIAEENNFISRKHYLSICKNYGLDKDRAFFLGDYLHDLGVFLNFKDNPILKKIVILNPTWCTDAVYNLLDSQFIKEQHGVFSKNDLYEIWDEPRYFDMQDELLELMMKFELCYHIPQSLNYIAPQLLQVNQPQYSWNYIDNIIVKYDYDFMPKGIITRLIVRLHRYIKNHDLVWKEGVVLKREGANAEIIETYGRRALQIRVEGKNRKELLTIILEEVDNIHKTYIKLAVTKLIPCTCSDCNLSSTPHFYKYNILKRYLNNNKTKIVCDKSLKDVEVSPLIEEVNTNKEKRKKKIFISYSRTDIKLKEKLDLVLAPLKRLEIIETWDNHLLKPGEEVDDTILYNLENSNIILILLSPEFIATKFSYSLELKRAIKKHRKGEVKLVPIILRPCLWEDLEISDLQVLPRNEIPISMSPNQDETFTEIAKEIKNLIVQKIR